MAVWFANRGQVVQALLAALAAFIGGVGLYFTLRTNNVLPTVRPVISVVAVLLIFLLLLLAGAGRFELSISRFVGLIAGSYHGPTSAIFVPEPAHSLELTGLHQLYTRLFGEDVPTLAQMRLWHAINKNIFQLVVEKDTATGTRTIVGSFKVVPLKKEAIGYLELGVVTGTTLDANHIVKPGGRPSAWYIGDVVSTSKMSAHFVMKALLEYLSDHLNERTPIFARALSEKGLKYLREFNFTPVYDGKMEIGQVCSLMGQDVDDLIARLHSSYPRRRLRDRGKNRRSTPPPQL